MVAKQKGLGQGVSLLFGEDAEEKYFQCAIGNIRPNRYQPRSHFDEGELADLAQSIREKGVIQPLIVIKSADNHDGLYDLIAGERRLRASKLAGLESVPVVVMESQDEDALLELALIENVQRTDLNPLEEAEAYQKLISTFGYTQEETAKRVGKKRSTISNSIRLLNLPDFIREDIVHGLLSEGHARCLLRLSSDISGMRDVRNTIIKKGLSVRQTEKLVKKYDRSISRPAVETKTRSSSEIPNEYCRALANQLSNALSSKVSIVQNGSRGKVEIEYYSADDLERLVTEIMNQ